MQTFNQTFAAGSINRFDIPGEFFRLLTGTALRVEFFKGGASLGYADSVNAGFYDRKPEGFDSVSITDATGQAVKFAISNDEIGSADAVSVSGTVTTAPAFTTPAHTRVSVTTAAALLAANAARRGAQIQNTSTSEYLRIDVAGGTPSASNGFRIAPGGSWENPAGCSPVSAINGISESGTAISVEISEFV